MRKVGRGPALAFAFVACAATAAHAEVALVGAVSGGKPTGAPTLVGASGEIFEPRSPGVWQRTTLGGVSADVIGAMRDGTRLFAIPVKTPLFEQVGGVWFARPLTNRGTITLAQGGAPLIAIGKHVYALQKGTFKRVTTAPKPVSALWSRDGKQILCATAGDTGSELWKLSGNRWTQISATLPAGDALVFVCGKAIDDLLLRFASGSLMTLSRTGAQPLLLPMDLVGFSPEACVDSKTGLRVAGALQTTTRSGVVTTLSNKLFSGVESLGEIAPGEAFSGLFSQSDGGLVAVTRAGSVFFRGAAGWARGQLKAPEPTSAPITSPPR